MSSSSLDNRANFVVEVDGFAGPLELLLELARADKVDLRHISLTALADQYLAFLVAARERQLQIAAEYLVMAAWLVYLKSQLLLPVPERQEPDADALAHAVSDRLRRLAAVRAAAHWLERRPCLGSGRWVRGEAPVVLERVEPRWAASLTALFRAYARAASRQTPVVVHLPRRRLYGADMALQHLSRSLAGRDWRDLISLLPSNLMTAVERKAAVTATLVAGLELARDGRIELEQAAPFAPIMVRCIR